MPVVTGTVHVVPLPVTVPIEAPVTVGESEKLETATPVMDVEKVTVQFTVLAFDGVESARATEETVAPTANVVLADDAEAEFPAVSVAVPDASVIPSVPVPVMLEMVTVRVVPLPDTASEPSEVPVLLSVIFPVASVLELKFESA